MNKIVEHISGENVEPIRMDFFTAAALGLRATVRHYVIRGQNVNEQNEDGWTALMYAFTSSKNELVCYFLNLGADVTPTDKLGRTCLIVAAEAGNLASLRTLKDRWYSAIQENGDECSDKCKGVSSIVNARECRNGYTAIMFAAIQGNREMVELLFGFGADAKFKDFRGQTAITLATSNGHKKTAVLLRLYTNEYTVSDMLHDIGLGKYAVLFNNVSVESLLHYSDADLSQLGLRLLGPRKKLLVAIDELREMMWSRYKLRAGCNVQRINHQMRRSLI